MPLTINLKELYGEKYKVAFDRESYYRNMEILRKGPSKVTFTKEDFYSILCKFGEIFYDGNDDFSLYCTSVKIANKIQREMEGKVICEIVDDEGMIYFKFQDIKKIFRYVKPRRKRHNILTEEGKRKLLEGLKKYREEKVNG